MGIGKIGHSRSHKQGRRDSTMNRSQDLISLSRKGAETLIDSLRRKKGEGQWTSGYIGKGRKKMSNRRQVKKRGG